MKVAVNKEANNFGVKSSHDFIKDNKNLFQNVSELNQERVKEVHQQIEL